MKRVDYMIGAADEVKIFEVEDGTYRVRLYVDDRSTWCVGVYCTSLREANREAIKMLFPDVYKTDFDIVNALAAC